MKKYLIEFIGTFFLVLTIALTGNPIAIGVILTAMIYMGGYISGAHYNPAVTTAVWVRGKIDSMTALRYMGIQVVAGLVAALVFYLIKGTMFIPAPSIAGYSIPLAVEIIYTFALASVVLHVATSKRTDGNQYFGLAIGLTVMAAAFAGGPISGGAYNPAVAIGPYILEGMTATSSNVLIYILGPLAGGALAGYVYRYIEQEK